MSNQLLHFADRVRAALIRFSHTNNPDLLDLNELRELCLDADGIIAREAMEGMLDE